MDVSVLRAAADEENQENGINSESALASIESPENR